MAIARIAGPTNKGKTASPATQSFAVPSVGTDKVLTVRIWSSNADPTSVTYAGIPLTKIGSQQEVNHGRYAAAWRLVGPPVGTADVVVTAGGSSVAFTVDCWSGVDQATPVGTTSQSNSTEGNTWTYDHSSQTNDIDLDTALTYFGQLDDNGAQTVDYDDGDSGFGNGWLMSWQAGAPTTEWDFVYVPYEGSTNPHQAHFLFSLRNSIGPRARIVAYTDDLASDDRRLLDANGNRLQPWEIRADAWVRYAGWAPPSSVVYDSLVDDPTCGYIEEASWDSDSEVATTTTSRMDLGEIFIARASAQSAG